MLGAIIGDMVGSIYEFDPCKTKDFDIFNTNMRMTDDSALTLAVARALMKNYPIDYSKKSLEKIKQDTIHEFVDAWNKDRSAGYGSMFFNWCVKASRDVISPYNSCGNGSAMRISLVAWVTNTEEELKKLCRTVTIITHNHPEGLKGAEAVAMAIFMALHGSSKEEIGERMIKDYYPEIATFDLVDLITSYKFSELCQNSVPQAIYCFLVSTSLEDAIRNCVAIGGDCDTTGAMAGAIAEAYYQKDKLSEFEDKYLYFMIDSETEQTIKDFHKMIGSKKFE